MSRCIGLGDTPSSSPIPSVVPFDSGFGLPSTHGTTCEIFGVVTHVRGGEILTCKVGDPITEIVLTRCGEAALLTRGRTDKKN